MKCQALSHIWNLLISESAQQRGKFYHMDCIKGKKVPSNMCKMHRFRSSYAYAKHHTSLCSPFIHSVVSNDSVSKQWRFKLCRCAGWSGPSLSAYTKDMFWHGPYVYITKGPFCHMQKMRAHITCVSVQSDLGLLFVNNWTVNNGSVRRQWRPLSDCITVQAVPGLHC